MLDIRNLLARQGLLAGNEMLANLITARRRDAAKAMASTKPWYRIDNANNDEAELWLYDEISWWGVSADRFAQDLRAITAPKIKVRISSPGGDVFDGIAIMNALRSHPAHVTTQVDSLAASIAAVIAQAGDTRVMVQHSTMMIHEAHGMFWGNADETRAFADLLDKVSDNIAGIYDARSGEGKGDRDAFRALMRAETWLSDTEAVELGLADEVVIPAPTNDPADGQSAPPAAPKDTESDAPTDAGRDRIRARWLSIVPGAQAAANEELV